MHDLDESTMQEPSPAMTDYVATRWYRAPKWPVRPGLAVTSPDDLFP